MVKRLLEILKIRKGLVNDLITSNLMSLSASTRPISIWAWRKHSKRRGISTVHYVRSSVWAWRRERVNKIVHQVQPRCCVCSQWSHQLYLDAGGETGLSGHPMAQTMPLDDDRAAAHHQDGRCSQRLSCSPAAGQPLSAKSTIYDSFVFRRPYCCSNAIRRRNSCFRRHRRYSRAHR